MNKMKVLSIKKTLEKTLKLKVFSLIYLEEGISNFNYLVNDMYVAKFVDQRISLENSKKNVEIASAFFEKKGLTPKHYFYPDFTLVDYIPNAGFLNKDNFHTYLPKLVTTIKAIHKIDPTSISRFDMIKRLHIYKDKLKEKIELPQLEQVIAKVKSHLDKAQLKVSHNDLVRGNLLIVNDEIKIIDFEYLGLNDPDFDVVSYLSENDYIDDEIREAFLKAYYEGSIIPQEKLSDYERFADALWFYWATFSYQETKKAIFQEIALIKYNKYLNSLTF